jgi:hypothetical protein
MVCRDGARFSQNVARDFLLLKLSGQQIANCWDLAILTGLPNVSLCRRTIAVLESSFPEMLPAKSNFLSYLDGVRSLASDNLTRLSEVPLRRGGKAHDRSWWKPACTWLDSVRKDT